MSNQDLIQGLYDRLAKNYDLKHFRHASDTTGNRQAGYVVYVSEHNNVWTVYSGYGRLGTHYRETNAGAYGGLANAIQKANDIIQAKLNKNYVEDTNLVNMKKTVKVQPKQPGLRMPQYIERTYEDMPDNDTIPPSQEILHNEDIHLEWYPNRMRFNYILVTSSYYAVYNISGTHLSEGVLPSKFSPTEEFKKMANVGLLFLCYEDPNGNFVFLRYLRNNTSSMRMKGYTYQKQRLILEMVLQEMVGKDIDITEDSLPFYMNPSYTTPSSKEDMARRLQGRNGINKFVSNLAMFSQTDNMEKLLYIER